MGWGFESPWAYHLLFSACLFTTALQQAANNHYTLDSFRGAGAT